MNAETLNKGIELKGKIEDMEMLIAEYDTELERCMGFKNGILHCAVESKSYFVLPKQSILNMLAIYMKEMQDELKLYKTAFKDL